MKENNFKISKVNTLLFLFFFMLCISFLRVNAYTSTFKLPTSSQITKPSDTTATYGTEAPINRGTDTQRKLGKLHIGVKDSTNSEEMLKIDGVFKTGSLVSAGLTTITGPWTFASRPYINKDEVEKNWYASNVAFWGLERAFASTTYPSNLYVKDGPLEVFSVASYWLQSKNINLWGDINRTSKGDLETYGKIYSNSATVIAGINSNLTIPKIKSSGSTNTICANPEGKLILCNYYASGSKVYQYIEGEKPPTKFRLDEFIDKYDKVHSVMFEIWSSGGGGGGGGAAKKDNGQGGGSGGTGAYGSIVFSGSDILRGSDYYTFTYKTNTDYAGDSSWGTNDCALISTVTFGKNGNVGADITLSKSTDSTKKYTVYAGRPGTGGEADCGSSPSPSCLTTSKYGKGGYGGYCSSNLYTTPNNCVDGADGNSASTGNRTGGQEASVTGHADISNGGNGGAGGNSQNSCNNNGKNGVFGGKSIQNKDYFITVTWK